MSRIPTRDAPRGAGRLGPAVRRLGLALVAAIALAGAPAAAEDGTRPAPRDPLPDALGRIALEALLRALGEAMGGALPYALPEINERGDIIIRRLTPRAETPRPAPRPRPPAGSDETST